MILQKMFLDKYRDRPVDWGPIGLVTFLTFYSRLMESGKKEDWVDTCARVSNGTYDIQKWHCKVNDRPWNDAKGIANAHKMFEMMFNFMWVPPGRGIWAMGTDAMWKHGGGVLNNCGFFSTKDDIIHAFRLLMHFSMLGVGCGFDTRGNGTRVIQRPSHAEVLIDIEDTREGWVDSTMVLLTTYLCGGPTPVFNYKKIRKKGAPLVTFGGAASGPDPLIKLHGHLRKMFDSYIGKRVDTELLADIGNYIGVCVEAGGIRRSAEIILGQYGDQAFYRLKMDPELVKDRRYMSNNSVICEPGCDYTEIAAMIAKNGEPGIFWLYNAMRYGRMNGIMNPADMWAMGVNPCVEQTLWDLELCNLVETFPSRHANLHQYMRTLKMAYLYAKTVTLMKTGFPDVDAIIEQNRRIGCSQSGIIKAFQKHGRYNMLDWSDKGYDFLTGLDADFSCWFGVNRSIKRTSIKPSGTVPLLCGETGALNYPISEFYYRTIRIADNNPILSSLEKAGYRIEPNQYGGDSNMVVYFPVHEENFVKGEADVSMWEQLENAAAYQEKWADNQVSTTIKFDKKEANDIPVALEMYQNRLKAVSFLPKDTTFYPQAPYQPIDEREYAKYRDSLSPIDYSNIHSEATAPSGCDGGKCTV